MKTKEQILKYFRAQPWYRTFINCCIDNYKMHYNSSGINVLGKLEGDHPIADAFSWYRYKDYGIEWGNIQRIYLDWYNED